MGAPEHRASVKQFLIWYSARSDSRFPAVKASRWWYPLSTVPTSSSLAVAQFRADRPGPELVIQDTVAQGMSSLITSADTEIWTASSLPLGAGIPDLVVASYYREVLALANVEISHFEILAYLRVVGRARPETIAARLRTPEKAMRKQLEALVDVKALSVYDDVFVMPTLWKDILPEIVTIEVKVSNWRRAVEQAARNRMFAHRSYVALPARVAERVRTAPLFRQLGLGLIAVYEEKTVRVIRRPRRRQPVVWTYYYKLASVLARSFRN